MTDSQTPPPPPRPAAPPPELIPSPLPSKGKKHKKKVSREPPRGRGRR